MTTRIAYNAESNEGTQVAEFVDAVMEALAKGRRLKPQLDSMIYGDPADHAALEKEIGGPVLVGNAPDQVWSMVPGTGQPLWFIISAALSAIDCPAVAELARLDKG